MKVFSACLALFTLIGCASVSRADVTATPVITLATGTYAMPTSTTITDATPGASIAWCYVGTGTCTPATAYSGSIYVDPATTETICANATASGDTVSATVCNSYTAKLPNTATPVITLASGTYVSPTNTTITDLTSGASIQWCFTKQDNSCTPSTPYTHPVHIDMDQAATQTICANATSSTNPPSNTICNHYNAGDKSDLSFSYSDGQLTMSTALPGATIFYTLDGSTATEASIEYTGTPVPVDPGTVIHAAAVQMESNGATGVAVQNGQVSPNNFKTVLASTAAQSAPYTQYYNSPHVQYGSGGNKCNQGVCGIPTAIGMIPNQPLPTVTGSSTATNFNMTTENLPGAGNGLQVLWPYNASTGGCDSCTSMIEDFYIWPQYTSTINPANVENWELDMNSWNLTIPTYGYLGASFQCSIIDGGWQYNGQHAPGWTNFSSTGSSSMTKINHDCQLPFGTLATSIDSPTQQSFTVTPNVTGSVTAATVEPGMILLIDNEEILCTAASGNTCTASKRGWAGTGATTHAAGALYTGSVHVQYHVTFDPGVNNCLLNGKSGASVECVYIDYMIINNVKFDFHALYGEQTVNGVPGYSALTIPAYIYTYPPDRVFDQKQIDVKGGIGSPSSPVEVGEFIDRDNVTASFGVLASGSFTVPPHP